MKQKTINKLKRRGGMKTVESKFYPGRRRRLEMSLESGQDWKDRWQLSVQFSCSV